MASGFFAVLDDIAALMDDVAISSKVAAKQTAGILGDDLAVNAEQATGFLASREVPVLLAIMKGSFINKLIIIPVVMLLQFYYPPAIKVILVLGGIYLSFEGVEKIFEYFSPQHQADGEVAESEIADIADEQAEKAKIKAAVATDFILSIEIVIIALSTVLHAPITVQIATVTVVSFLATAGVYGIVAAIVRMDDAGYKIVRRAGESIFLKKLGFALISALPKIIKILAVVGTFALLLVSGGIFLHHVDFFHSIMPRLPEFLRQLLAGLAVGSASFALVAIMKKILPGRHQNINKY